MGILKLAQLRHPNLIAMVYKAVQSGVSNGTKAAGEMIREHVLPAGRDVTRPIIAPFQHPTAEEDAATYAQIGYNLYSDTVTLPTQAMRTAMAEAQCGDDVHLEHPTTTLFQDLIAKVTGKEAALFLPSGTLSNQLALHAHLTRAGGPASVLCDKRAHVYAYETGGIAYHSRAATQTVAPSNAHHLTLEDIQAHAVLDEDQHYAPTRVIELENTLSGTIFPQDEIVRISDWAHDAGLIMHLDGARLWNVAAETGLALDELCRPFDTVSLCLSKGIGAPIGSILVGPADLLRRVRTFRKLFGAGMRQTAVLTSAAHVAVHDVFPKLRGTHDLARRCAAMLAERGIPLLLPTETNMVWFDVGAAGYDPEELVRRAAALDPPITMHPPRLVFHHQIRPDAVDRLAAVLDAMKA